MTSGAVDGYVYVTTEGDVSRVVLCQPGKRNAMTLTMWRQLCDAVRAAGEDPDIKVIIVCGEGEQAFCAGADIDELRAFRPDSDDAERYTEALNRAQAALLACVKPTLACIRGACVGGGAIIALACRLRIADDAMRFSIPAARVGLVYNLDAVARLAAVVGESCAYDLLVSTRTVGADEARRTGLVNAVHPAPDYERAVERYVDSITRSSAASVEGVDAALRALAPTGDPDWRARFDLLERQAFDSYHHGQAFGDLLKRS